METRKVSAVIPAYNAERTIRDCVQALAVQSYPVDEIIVVDDCSRDATKSEVASLALPHCKVISLTKNGGLPHARNVGIREAKNGHIYFVDSDTLPQKDALEWLMKGFDKDDAIAVVSGPNPNSPELRNIFNITYEIVSRFQYSAKLGERYDLAIGGNFCVKKEVAEEVGLWDERLITHEDRDFFLRVRLGGYKVFFQPRAIGWHFSPRSNFKSYLKNSFNFGLYGTIFRFKNKPDAAYSKYYPENLPLFLLLLPGIVLYSTVKPLFYNLGIRPIREILMCSPIIFFGQLVMGVGAIKGFNISKKIRKEIS
jgi:GT2 family glycosyltransferase